MPRLVKRILLVFVILISVQILFTSPAKISAFFWLAFMWGIGLIIYRYRAKISDFIFVKAEYDTDDEPTQPKSQKLPKNLPHPGATATKRSSLTVDEEEVWNNLTSSIGYENYDPPIPYEDMNPLNFFKKRKNKKK